MLILLYGEDTFRSRQKLNAIVKEYQTKHKSGLNLVLFREEGLDFDKVKEKIEAASMFNEKKLIILEGIFKNKDFQERFFQYAQKAKLKNNQEVVLVIRQEGKLARAGLKRQVNMWEEFKLLEGASLVNWVKKEVAKNKRAIAPEAVSKLVAYVGNDLWQMNNEINKLLSYQVSQPIKEENIDLLVRAKIDVNIFKTLDALANRDKKTALKLLHQHLSQGTNEIYLFSMFVYQVRSLLKLKDLIEKGTPFYGLTKQSGLHPYVVKKSWPQIRNFNLDQLKKIYQRLLEIELSLKSGRIDGETALDMLVAEI